MNMRMLVGNIEWWVLYEVESAYGAIAKLEGGSSGTVWKAIWRAKTPQRVGCFMWLATKERLMTNVTRAVMAFSKTSDCDFFIGQEENAMHALREKVFIDFARISIPRFWHATYREMLFASFPRGRGTIGRSIPYGKRIKRRTKPYIGVCRGIENVVLLYLVSVSVGKEQTLLRYELRSLRGSPL